MVAALCLDAVIIIVTTALIAIRHPHVGSLQPLVIPYAVDTIAGGVVVRVIIKIVPPPK